MTYLLDTNIVSALRVRGRHPRVEAWAGAVPIAEQFVSAFTIAEIERGVVKKERSDPAQAEVLRRWLEERVLAAFADRIMSFDLAAARVLGSFRVPEHSPLDDALIAAVAVAQDKTVVTRNTKHFEQLRGVRLLNPWTVEVAGDEPNR